MSWKDEYREEKDASGLTWDEFHERRFVHVDELDSATTTLSDLRDHVDAAAREYRDLKRELSEVRIMLESDEFEP